MKYLGNIIAVILLVGCMSDVHTMPEEPSVPEVPQTVPTGQELRCGGPIGIECLDAVWTEGIIHAELQNNLGYDIKITKLTQYDDEEPWSTITYCRTDQNLSLDVSAGEKFILQIDCSGFDRLDQGFEITVNGEKKYIGIKS